MTTGDAAIVVVDMGGTHVRLGLARSTGAPAKGTVVSTDRLRVADPVAALGALIEAETAGLAARAAGVVLGVPGFMDATRRVVVDTPNIAALRGVPLADRLEQACGLPVWLEHDAALLLRGEAACGAAAGADPVFGIFFGTGIGASVLKAGRPVLVGPYSMQLGHIPVRGEGRRCPCGGIDCIETYASGLALRDLAHRFGRPVERLFADAAPAELESALGRFIEDQAVAVATGITLFDPAVVVIGGGVVDMAGYPMARLAEAVSCRVTPVHGDGRVRLARAELGWSAVLHGALGLVAEAQR
jgi:allose kinase